MGWVTRASGLAGCACVYVRALTAGAAAVRFSAVSWHIVVYFLTSSKEPTEACFDALL